MTKIYNYFLLVTFLLSIQIQVYNCCGHHDCEITFPIKPDTNTGIPTACKEYIFCKVQNEQDSSGVVYPVTKELSYYTIGFFQPGQKIDIKDFDCTLSDLSDKCNLSQVSICQFVFVSKQSGYCSDAKITYLSVSGEGFIDIDSFEGRGRDLCTLQAFQLGFAFASIALLYMM